MSVCVSVIPVCATNQELNLTVLFSSLSVYANYSCLLPLLKQSEAESCQLVSSLSIASAICIKRCIPYLVIPWANTMCDAAKMMHGVAEIIAKWGLVGMPGSGSLNLKNELFQTHPTIKSGKFKIFFNPSIPLNVFFCF